MKLQAVVVALLLCGACSDKPIKLNVCAAASLRASFDAIGEAFKAKHPGLEITLNSAGSQALKAQVEAGAPCDVLATADEVTMDALVTSGHVTGARRFASNSLVIVVPPTNPGKVGVWSDLAAVSRIALAAPEVPVGRYARKFIANADAKSPGFAAAVNERVKTNELDVAHVVMRVRQGEVDAGIAYRTDVGTGGVTAIDIPPELDVIADYPIAVVKASTSQALAEEFVGFVLGDGQATLSARGFKAARAK